MRLIFQRMYLSLSFFLCSFYLVGCKSEKKNADWISGVERPSDERVQQWLNQAKNHQDGDAAMSLSTYYFRFENDHKMGQFWMLKAADFGNENAQTFVKDSEVAWRVWRNTYEK